MCSLASSFSISILILFTCFSLGSSTITKCDRSNVSQTIIVDKKGSGAFKSIQDAINSIHSNNNAWIEIDISPGIYEETVTIPKEKPCIVLDGKGRNQTTITAYGHQATDISATFTVLADNVIARGITFQNSYNHYMVMDKSKVKPAVAARIMGDQCAFFECGFIGVQDTLWDGLGRHYFSSCYIEGAIDFIFGHGQSVYEEFFINSTVGTWPFNFNTGFITAQDRQSEEDPSGFVFSKGTVFTTAGSTFLGRAYGPYSRVIFQDATLGSGVAGPGWDSWHYGGKEENFMYAEVDCNGLGYKPSERVPWVKHLNGSQIEMFSKRDFINQGDWLYNQPLKDMIKNQ